MKSRYCFCGIIICIVFFNFTLGAFAQRRISTDINDSELSISFLAKKVNAGSNMRKIDSSSKNILFLKKNKTFSRIVFDSESGLYFGYDLSVDFDGASEIVISIKPLSITPAKIGNLKDISVRSLSNYPEPIKAEVGDLIVLDILENPKTKWKLIDTIRISKRISSQKNLGLRDSSRDFSSKELNWMKLTNIKILLNGREVANPGSVYGPIAIAYFYIPKKGRFIFSLSPHEGYNFKKIGKLVDNEISFTINGDKYKLTSDSVILAVRGSWNLWVLHDTDYRPRVGLGSYSPYWFGVASKMKTLMTKK